MKDLSFKGIICDYRNIWGSPNSSVGKESSCRTETRVRSLGREDPWKMQWLPTPVFLPGESHGQRSLVGYSPWSRKESDTTKQLTLSQAYIKILLNM